MQPLRATSLFLTILKRKITAKTRCVRMLEIKFKSQTIYILQSALSGSSVFTQMSLLVTTVSGQCRYLGSIQIKRGKKVRRFECFEIINNLYLGFVKYLHKSVEAAKGESFKNNKFNKTRFI